MCLSVTVSNACLIDNASVAISVLARQVLSALSTALEVDTEEELIQTLSRTL